MEKLVIFALPIIWAGFTMYWARTKAMTAEFSWRGWQGAYILSIAFMALALYGQFRWLWGMCSIVALVAGEFFAWSSQGMHFPYKISTIARRLGEFAAFCVFLWIML